MDIVGSDILSAITMEMESKIFKFVLKPTRDIFYLGVVLLSESLVESSLFFNDMATDS